MFVLSLCLCSSGCSVAGGCGCFIVFVLNCGFCFLYVFVIWGLLLILFGCFGYCGWVPRLMRCVLASRICDWFSLVALFAVLLVCC